MDLYPYKKLIVYYFSGTGNSKKVASWISDIALKHNIVSIIVNIADIDRHNVVTPAADALVIFVSPVHGFNYPPVMLNFILHFPKGNNKMVLMNTRAGMLIGKFITPGLTGVAFYFSALILTLKGYSIKGMIPVDLPSNWISLHPGLNERTVTYLHERNKKRVTKHAEKILSGKNNFIALREMLQDVAVAPVSLGYYFIGRFFFAKTFYASGKCTNCGLCIKNCPVKAIKLKNGRPYWTFNCESCMKCMSYCPEKAVETAHGFAIGILVLNSLVIAPLFYKYFNLLFPGIKNGLLKATAESFLILLFLAILYRILHFSMRFRFMERLMVYTSLTWYKWWGRRYKAPKNI